MSKHGEAAVDRSSVRSRVRLAVAEVRKRHPFSHYVEDTAEELAPVGELVAQIAPYGGRLLDIGCGALDKTAVFALLGFDCSAVDDFEDSWHQTEGATPALEQFADELGIDLVTAGAESALPWDDGTFDVVTLLAVVEHLPSSPRELLNEAGRLLKENGVLILTMPNSVNLRKRLHVLIGRTNYPPAIAFYENIGSWRGHVREYTRRETEQILEWTGFEVIASQTFGGMVNRRLRSRLLRRIYRCLTALRPNLKDSIFVAARRPPSWVERAADAEAARRSIADAVPGSTHP